MTEPDIEQLEQAVTDATYALAAAEAALKAARLDALPFSVGDVVRSHHNGDLFIVREIRPWSSGGGWCFVSPRKKNGEWSKARTSNSVSTFTKVDV